MKKVVLSFLLFGVIMTPSPVSVGLLNTGNGATDSTGQYYVGPYTLAVNGSATLAMCLNDNVENHGNQWFVNITATNSLDFSSTYLGNPGAIIDGESYTSSQVYNAEAYLFSLIVQPGAEQANIQEAAWFILDPSSPAYGSIADVQGYVSAATDNPPDFDASGYSIISDVIPGGHQEFMVSAAATSIPEPGSVALLGCGLLVAGVVRLRRGKS